jgi:hypothetical protein
MPVHDWTQVEAGVFHSFHTTWIGQINNALNGGVLPEGYYALAEQHMGMGVADVLTLHASAAGPTAVPTSSPGDVGGIAVAAAPPLVQRKQTADFGPLGRRRSIAIRHVSGHRLVALLEILSPANKDRMASIHEFTDKAAEALHVGVHLLVIDLFPPGKFDPAGMHGVMWEQIAPDGEPYDLPAGASLTLASYAARRSNVDIYLEHLAVGAVLKDMPLFLSADRYVNVPLEETYMAAYRGVPAIWRQALERPSRDQP